MSTPQDEMRAKFEAWATCEGQWPKAIQRDASSGEYKLLQTANDWVAWQAAEAAQAEALAAVTRERDALREYIRCSKHYDKVLSVRSQTLTEQVAHHAVMDEARVKLQLAEDEAGKYLATLTTTAPGAQEQA